MAHIGTDYIGRRKMAIEAERNKNQQDAHSEFMERRLNELETAQTELKHELKQDLQQVLQVLSSMQRQQQQ